MMRGIIYIALIALVGCDPGSTLESWEIEQAVSLCESHGGVDRVEMDHAVITTKELYCNDGSRSYHGKVIDPPSSDSR